MKVGYTRVSRREQNPDRQRRALEAAGCGRIFGEKASGSSRSTGPFNGKQSPVHLPWHSFDLAVTRFSDRRADLPEGTGPVTREAHSHEVISCGFWPGDRNVREPAFYSYTAPEPEGLTDRPLKPTAASWQEGGTATLTYEEVRGSASPKDALLEFLQSAYEAGAKTANWDVEDLKARPVRRVR